MAKIAIQTSSGLQATSGLSLSVSSVPNNGATAESAPVLLTLQSSGTMNAEGLAKAICAIATSFTEVEGRYIVNAVEQALVEIVTNCQYPTNIQLGFATFLWEVAGSLEAADAAANPITNIPFMTGLVPERYRKVFASYDTFVPTGDQPCVLKRIRDKATNVAAIMGNSLFYLEGKGMTYGGTGEKVELYDELMLTKKCDLTVQTHDSQILFECKIPSGANVPVGNYRIKITTLAGGGSVGGILYTSDLKVSVGEAATPTASITSVQQTGRAEPNTIKLSPVVDWVINGTDLAHEGDTVWVELYSNETGELIDWGNQTDGDAPKIVSSTPTKITLSGVYWESKRPDGEWYNAYPLTKVVIKRGTQRIEFPMTFTEN